MADNVTLKQCIMRACGIGPHQIFGGPEWIAFERFEIRAKADQPVDDEILMQMLQNLLEERFSLRLHAENRVMRAFVLEIAKNGPKLEKAPAGEAGTDTSNSNNHASITAHNINMDLLARTLARQLDLPVVNRTRLKGVFLI